MDLGSLIAAVLLSIGMIGADAAINAGTIAFKVEVTEELSKKGYTRQLVDSLLDNSLKQLVEFRSFVHPPQLRSSEEKSIVGAIAESLNLKDVTASFQSEMGLNPVRLTGTLMPGNASGTECGRSSSSVLINQKLTDAKVTSEGPPTTATPTQSAVAARPSTAAPTHAMPPSMTAASAVPAAAPVPAPAAAKAAGNDEQLRFVLSGQSTHTGMFIIDCTSPKGQSLPDFLGVMATEIVKRVEPYAAGLALFAEMHRLHAFMQHESYYGELKAFVDGHVASDSFGADSGRDYASFQNLLGMAAMMAGYPDAAEAAFVKASEVDPEIGYAWVNQALLHLSQKRFDDALQMVSHAKETKTVSKAPFLLANALTVQGLALWGKNDLQGASDAFLAAVQVYPGTFFGYYYWAKLMESAGDAQSAKVLTARANSNIASFETYPESALLYFIVKTDKDFKLAHVNFKQMRSAAEVDAVD